VDSPTSLALCIGPVPLAPCNVGGVTCNVLVTLGLTRMMHGNIGSVNDIRKCYDRLQGICYVTGWHWMTSNVGERGKIAGTALEGLSYSRVNIY